MADKSEFKCCCDTGREIVQMLPRVGWLPPQAQELTAYDPAWSTGAVKDHLSEIFNGCIHNCEDFWEVVGDRLTTPNLFVFCNPPWVDCWLSSFFQCLLLWGGPFLLILPMNTEYCLSIGEFEKSLESRPGWTTHLGGLQNKYPMKKEAGLRSRYSSTTPTPGDGNPRTTETWFQRTITGC